MNSADFHLRDNDGQLIRALARRIAELERRTKNDVPLGAVAMISHPIPRSAKWSDSRAESVASSYSRWWKFNDINQSQSQKDVDENSAATLSLDPAVLQGEIGGLTSEGGYSIYNPVAGSGGISASGKGVVTGQRNWTVEAVFAIETTGQTQPIFYNGGSGNGYGIYLDGGVIKGSISGGFGFLSTSETAETDCWYHLIVVARNSGNVVKWYLGKYDEDTRTFSYSSGSATVASNPVAPNGNLLAARHRGWLDEGLIYNSELTDVQAEDRIRTALQPSPPSGWMICDGSPVGRNQFPKLFRRIGVRHGAGDGSTTFNLPNIPGGIIKF